MIRRAYLTRMVSVLPLAFLAQAPRALGCAACYGQSDSPMAQGMNWGILSLLAVVVLVLGGVASFFAFLARKSSTVGAAPGQALSTEKI